MVNLKLICCLALNHVLLTTELILLVGFWYIKHIWITC